MSQIVLPSSESSACANCAEPLAGPFCAACGQRAGRARLTLRSVLAHVVAEVVNLDRGFLFTFLQLWRRPGGVARDYVRGRTVLYTNPAKYFLVVGALTTLVYVRSGLAGQVANELAEGMRAGTNGEVHPRAGAVLEILSSYLTLLLAFTLPTTALASRWVFRRAGFNYAEHLILNTYVGAQQGFVMIGAVVLGAVLGGGPQAWLHMSIPVVVALYLWTLADFLQDRRVATYLRAALAAALSYVFFALLAGLVGVAFGVAVAIARAG